MIWAVDATEAYLQSHELSRNAYATVPREFRKVLRGYGMRIIKPVYGLQELAPISFGITGHTGRESCECY